MGGIKTQGPLSGFKIIDLSRVLSGPCATMLLADQGADVVKVEPPGGDITRLMGVGNTGMTSGFLNINRGKRAISVNLHTEKGIEIIKKLAKSADVFVQNFRPGAVDKMGLGLDLLRKINSRLVTVSISGFGPSGPYAEKRVYDPVIQALSGITDIQADPDGRPRMIRTVIPDKTTALTAAQAITAALLAREKTGMGQHIELAMLDAMIAYLWPEGMINLTVVDDKRDIRVGQIAQDLIFKTKDGYITAGAMSDAEWKGMCRVLGKPEWIEDKRFKTTAARFINAKERISGTAKILEGADSKTWLEKLDKNGVPCAPVLSRSETICHEQVVNNELIHEYTHPGLGVVRQPRPAARFEHSEINNEPKAPMLGQHNKEVLLEVGYTVAEIDKFSEDRILVSA